ncbi:MAG: hypothetical protein LBT01_06000, partial [Spirochaetaceae bacterium]|nr:hypothetical protein [Spirochaetaceae bacterium]
MPLVREGRFISTIIFTILLFFAQYNSIFAIDETSVSSEVRDRELSRETLLKERLADENITFTEESLLSADGADGADGASIYVDLDTNSEGVSERTNKTHFVLAIPISSLGDTDDDFHFGFELAINYIKKTLNEGTAIHVRVAFLGDEWEPSAGASGFAGLRALLDSIKDDNTVVLYARLCGGGLPLHIIQSSKRYTTPLSLLKPFVELCNEKGFPIDFPSNYNFLYRYGIAQNTAQLDMASERGIDMLYVQSVEGGANEGAAEKLSTIVSLWIESAEDFSETIITDNIKNYIILNLKDNFIIISEIKIVIFTYIAGLLLLFSAVMLYKYKKCLRHFHPCLHHEKGDSLFVVNS